MSCTRWVEKEDLGSESAVTPHKHTKTHLVVSFPSPQSFPSLPPLPFSFLEFSFLKHYELALEPGDDTKVNNKATE